jgi:hypothetical protein
MAQLFQLQGQVSGNDLSPAAAGQTLVGDQDVQIF